MSKKDKYTHFKNKIKTYHTRTKIKNQTRN